LEGSNSFLAPIISLRRSTPEATFCYIHSSGQWSEFSIDDFFDRAARFARLFKSSGVIAGEVVAVALRHDVDAHAAFLGAMLIGAIPSYMPYPNVKHDHALYWNQHRTLFEHVRPRVILVYDELLEAMRDCAEGLGVEVVGQSAVDQFEPLVAFEPTGDDATALLQHSSGTTGLKKGVALSYGAITRQLASYARALGLSGAERKVVASWLPLYHDMGLITGFLLPIWLGAPIVMIDPFEWVARPPLLLEAIERFRATHVWLPNFAFLHLSRMTPRGARHDLSSLEAVVSCSEPCKPGAFDAFLDRFTDWGLREQALQTCYAMAETVFAVSQSDTGRPPRRLIVDRDSVQTMQSVRDPAAPENALCLLSNGPPIEGCRVAVMRDRVVVGEREIGEIVVDAEFMFSGYFKNDNATSKAFAGSWYQTGDIGFLDSGEVFVVGRLKEVIIVNGKNIFANDVENSLLGIPGLKPGRAVAFGYYSDRVGSEQLVIVAEIVPDGRPHTEIQVAVNRRIVDAVGVPCADVRLVPQGWLIKTTSGKVIRSENARKYASEFRAAQ
jgi:acyl-CoA synthetase (AMP-forming)/AMP-acid ligase II